MGNYKGWIGVDLDGTLAHYDQWRGIDHIGEPIAPMVERVKAWLAAGEDVRIFTARMHGHGAPIINGNGHGVHDVATPIKNWCLLQFGQYLPITNVKDYGMIQLWDDRAVQVRINEGSPILDPIEGRLLRSAIYNMPIPAMVAQLEIIADRDCDHDICGSDGMGRCQRCEAAGGLNALGEMLREIMKDVNHEGYKE